VLAKMSIFLAQATSARFGAGTIRPERHAPVDADDRSATFQPPALWGIAIADAPVGVMSLLDGGQDGPRIHHIAR